MLTPATIRGSLLPFLQSETYDYDPTRGFISRFAYRGVSRDQMQALQQDYIRQGIANRLHIEKDIASLEVEDSTQLYTLDYWEIVGSEERYDIFSHPTVLSICNDDMVAAIRQGIDNVSPGVTASQTIANIFTAAIFSTLSAGQKATLGRFVGLSLRGSTEFQRGLYVVRHTTNAPSNTTNNIADVGIDQIYSTAKLLSEVTNTGFWFPIMPFSMQYQIGNIARPAGVSVSGGTPQLPNTGTQSDFANYFWGWLKKAPTKTIAAQNRITISTEYVLENWSTDLYTVF